MPQALEDIKVLDLSRILAMPSCSMMLGDLGAEIIRVERLGAGDETRHLGPPWAGDQSAYYLFINRNKKSITVDLKKKEGQEIICRLAQRSDIFLENFLPGSLAEMGLGYEQIQALNPGIIYASLTGYGQHDPYRDQPGLDFIIQAQGGLMSIIGEPDGLPMKVGVAIVDITAGFFACSAILAAPHYRQKTGRGQYIDIALLDSQVAWVANLLVCSEKMDAGLVYNILKVLLEHQPELVAVHKEAKNFTLASTVIGSSIPFHPGAIKYFQEKGIKIK